MLTEKTCNFDKEQVSDQKDEDKYLKRLNKTTLSKVSTRSLKSCFEFVRAHLKSKKKISLSFFLLQLSSRQR